MGIASTGAIPGGALGTCQARGRRPEQNCGAAEAEVRAHDQDEGDIDMNLRMFTILGALILASVSVASADQLAKGDFEISFRFSYSDLDFEGRGGDAEIKEFVGTFGYMLTDHHQLGAGIGYAGFDSSDTVEYGGAYSYNFRAAQSLNPYVSAVILGFGGDRGDVFDFGYGAELGLKVYPWPHGGMLFGVTYRQLRGKGGVPDATQFIAFGGLTLKF